MKAAGLKPQNIKRNAHIAARKNAVAATWAMTALVLIARVMTVNKLSELSKPVAWPNGCNETAVNALRYLAENSRPIGGSSLFNTEHLYMIAREVERMSSEPLYSQEYVSALLQRGEKSLGRACELGAKLETAKHRIAELEAIATDYAGKFQKAQDALKYAAIIFRKEEECAEAAERRIAELYRARFIAWSGNMFAPVLARIKVDVKRRDGSVSVGMLGGNVVWYHSDRPDDVVAFALTVEGGEQ